MKGRVTMLYPQEKMMVGDIDDKRDDERE